MATMARVDGARRPEPYTGQRTNMSDSSDDDVIGASFSVVSIEKTDPPEGVSDGEWYDYVIIRGDSEIRWNRDRLAAPDGETCEKAGRRTGWFAGSCGGRRQGSIARHGGGYAGPRRAQPGGQPRGPYPFSTHFDGFCGVSRRGRAARGSSVEDIPTPCGVYCRQNRRIFSKKSCRTLDFSL